MSEPVQTRRVGRYVLDRLISRGGMGEIYLAHTEGAAGFKKPVCIKRILPHLSREREFVDRFIDEAHIVVNLTHGNIVPVLDMGEIDGDYFIAMEYLPGRDLRDIIKRYRQLDETMPLPLVAYVIGETCKALSYAHKKTDPEGRALHITHRDVSPSNVLVSREGVVKLTDFGIAKAMGKLGKSITGRLQGKFCYMSPEQASGQSVGHRSDIFSVATVAYELLTGVRPFEKDTDLGTLEAVKRAEVAAPSTHREGLSEALDVVILQALSADPGDRPVDAAELGRQLRATCGEPAATEADMAEELARLFPDIASSDATPRRGVALDDVLAMEAERILQASPYGESPTLTAARPRSSAGLEPGRSATPTPGPLTTPTPVSSPAIDAGDLREATPLPSYAYPAVQPRRPWVLASALGLMAGLAALVLWVTPGLLIETSITVECEPEGAEVLLDRALVGRCGVTERVTPGRHRIDVRLDGYYTWTDDDVVVDKGRAETVLLELERDPHIEVTIFVDAGDVQGRYHIGDLVWRSSGTPVEVLPGPVTIYAYAPNHVPTEQTLTITSPEQSPVIVLEPVPEVVAAIEEPVEGSPTGDEPGDGSEAHEEAAPDARVRVERVTLRLSGIPEGAVLTVDGQPQEDHTIRFDREDEDHALRVELEGYEPWVHTYNPARQGSTQLTISLQPVPELQRVFIWPEGHRAQVYVDGDLRGEAPIELDLRVGVRRIRVVNQEYDIDEEREVEIRPMDGAQRVVFSLD